MNLDGLKYIIDSPAKEHGGFHPTTVQIAKDAMAEIERLTVVLNDIRIIAMDHPCFDQDRFERRAVDELARVGGNICDWTMLAIKADDALKAE